MKPCVEISKHLLAESEQKTKQIVIKHLFDTYRVETFDYRFRRVSLITIRFTRRYYICRRQRLKSVCVAGVSV